MSDQNYDQLRPAYSICLIDGILWRDATAVHHRFQLVDQPSGRVLRDTLEIHTLELGRYTLTECDLPTASSLEWWLFWLLHAHEYEPDDLLRLFPQAAFQQNRELIGEFKNNGKTWRAAPEDVNMYDFPSDSQGKATPYGVFDAVANHCLVVICLSSATAAFAVNSIHRWWELYGRERYTTAKRLLIECDGGGCNGHRPRLWKWLLQELADDLGISITVRHFPRGASKWNMIEHRVFGRISQNWAGYPLRTLTRILGFIRGTTTQTGLKLDAENDPRTYEKGITISDAQMKTLNITHEDDCPNWNYTIHPRNRK